MMQRNINGTHQACAACKHQRKKCNDDCILAPYFPAEKTREFQAVHKVFGVANVAKLVKSVKEEDRRRTAESLIWEALYRQKDPVLGLYGEYLRTCEELKMIKVRSQNQSQVVHRAASGLMGWNGGGNGMNANGEIVDSYKGNSVVHSGSYLYSERGKQEREAGSVVMPYQPHSVNGYNPQFYLPGQFSPINGKTLEATAWESRS